MSGNPDYDLTPNLGLYKPNYNADVDNWGFHLNDNSDTIDALFPGGVGNTYLRLTGGELTGSLLVPYGGTVTPSLAFGVWDATGLFRSGAAIVTAVQGQVAFAVFSGGTQFYGPQNLLDNRITTLGDATAATDAMNLRTGDARYLGLAGGALTGPLTLASDPTNNLQAATKQYVDVTATGSYLPLSGGTLTGVLVLPQGSLSNSSLRFGPSQSNSGLYAVGTTTVVSALGFQMLTVSPASVTTGGPLVVPIGSITTPSLALGAADGTGLSRQSNTLVVGVQGQPALAVFGTGSQFYAPVSLLNNRITALGDPAAATDALNQRSGDARYLNVTATGGTTPRSLPDRFADVINVKDYGATGRGVADDTAAIQAALNAIPAGGAAVYFPTGVYLISAPLIVPLTGLSLNGIDNGIKLYGDGMGFTRFVTSMPASPFITCMVASGTSMFGLTIEGMLFQTYAGNYNSWHIIVQNVHDFTLRRCSLLSQNPSPAAIGGVRVASVGPGSIFYPRIEACTVLGGTVEYDTITDGWIQDSILQCIDPAEGGGRTASIHLTGLVCGDIKITNNHIYSGTAGGILCDAADHALMVVEGNMFDTNPPNPATAIGISIVTAGKLWSIVNNVFNAIPATTIQCWDLSSSTIANNTFIECGSGSGTAPTIAFNATATGCQSVVVANNAANNGSALAPPLHFVQENPYGANNNTYLGNSIFGIGYNAQPYQLYTGSTPLLRLPAGLSFGTHEAAADSDMTQHISLYDGFAGINVFGSALNLVMDAGAGSINFKVSGNVIGFVNANGLSATSLQVGIASGPTWTTGSAAPTATAPIGSLYSDVSGTVGATLYVSRGGGTWNAVSGV
jgi:Pectate lyase superfamily protein